MHSNGNENARLAEIVKNFGTPKILVVGDLMLDHYIYGKAGKVSQEAPVMALEWEREDWRLGGAANVALMAKALGAEVTVAGVRGADLESTILYNELRKIFETEQIVFIKDQTRPTTIKHRYIGQSNGSQGQQVLRVDRESREPISKKTADIMWGEFREGFDKYDAILISDYGKGVCTEDLMGTVIGMAKRHHIPVIADPCRGADAERYAGCTALTPNREEWDSMRSRLKLESAEKFITEDSKGITLRVGDLVEHFPTRPRTVYDVTGAGDAVLAMIGMCYANKVNPEDAARLANIAGGLEVERLGCVPITREEVIADLLPFVLDRHQSQNALNGGDCTKKSEKKRVVFTNGCFDLLHAGHVAFLEAAKREGDYLIVAINSDACVNCLKGPFRPICNERQRCAMLSALRCVDEVIVFSETTPVFLIHQIKPDVLVKGEPYRDISEVVGHEIVEAYGGTVKILPGVPGLSTTEILRRIRQCSS